MPDTPTINRRAVWQRLLDRAAAVQRSPTIREPAGYEFNPEVIDTMPPEAQTELALQLSKIVIDNSRVVKRRIIDPPEPIDIEAAKRGLARAMSLGRQQSRQGSTIMFAVREGAPIQQPQYTAVTLNGVKMVNPAELPLYNECDSCNTLMDPAVAQVTPGTTIKTCPACAAAHVRECPECHAHGFWYDMRTVGDRLLCGRCAERHLTECPRCGNDVPRGFVVDGQCETCRRSSFMRGHGYKPTPQFFINPTDDAHHVAATTETCFGVELETELPSGTNAGAHAFEACIGFDDFIYAKHDGSLINGVEYVSHPFSRGWFNGNGRGRWARFLDRLRTLKHQSYDPHTCGMHIHVSKRSLMGNQLLRMLRLIHNSPPLALQLSRRREQELMQWANPRGNDTRWHEALATEVTNMSPTKYTSLNVTRNTVEFRLFRGTLKESSFFANLEAVFAILDYCKLEATPMHPTGDGFKTWAETNAANYPNLVASLLRSTAKV